MLQIQDMAPVFLEVSEDQKHVLIAVDAPLLQVDHLPEFVQDSRRFPGRKFGVDVGLRPAASCGRDAMGQQEVHEHEASGGDGAGAAGRVSSSQVTKRQGQDTRPTAALDPLRPAR